MLTCIWVSSLVKCLFKSFPIFIIFLQFWEFWEILLNILATSFKYIYILFSHFSYVQLWAPLSMEILQAKNTGVGYQSLLQGIFPTQELNPGLPHCRQILYHVQFSSVQFLSHVRLFATPWTTALQACLSITNDRIHPNPCSLSQWCHPTISFSIVPFIFCPQSFPASGSFPMSQLFAWGGQSIGVSASTSVLSVNTGWISLQSKGFSRVFSNITVQKHQFFGAQLSL